MLLKSLRLNNIRSYDRLDLEFPSGYVLLVGDVGSGKSTILMAIEFALFGLGNIKGDRLLSKGERRGEVALTFEVDGAQYEVGRALVEKNGSIGQDPKGLYLVADGTTEPLTAVDLKSRVLQILNFRESASPRTHSRVYRYAVYTPQEEIKSILEGAGREDVIRKAFGVEDYKTAADNADVLRRQISHRKDKLSGRFAKLGEHRAELQDVAKEIDSLGGDLAALGRTQDALSGKLADIKTYQNSMEAQMKDLIRIREEKNQTEKEIANKKETQKKLMENIRNDRAEINKIKDDLQKLGSPKKPTNKAPGELTTMLEKVEQTERDVHAKESELKSCTADAADIRRELESLGSPRSPTNKAPGELTTMLEKVEQTERDVHAKESELKSCTADAADIRRELESLGSPRSPTNKAPGELTTMLEKVEQTERDVHAKESESESCTADAADIRRELESLGSPRSPTNKAPGELTTMLEKVEQTERDVHAKESELKSCTADAADIRRELESLGSPRSPTNKAPGELTTMLEKVEQTERDVHAKESESESCTADAADIRRELESLGSPRSPTNKAPGELTTMLEKVEQTERDVHAKESESESCTADVAALDAQLNGKSYAMIRDAISVLEGRIQSGEKKSLSKEQSIQNHNRMVGEKRNEIKTLKDSLQKAKDLGARCEYCGKDLDSEYVEGLLGDRRGRLASAESELSDMEREMEKDSKDIADIRNVLDDDRQSLAAYKKEESIAERKKAREDRLALLQADLASLNPEDHVPAGEPLPRDDGESPRGYLQRLLESLREYDSTVGSIRDLEARKKAREDRLALLQADLASLNPEDHVPAGEPLPRDDGESPRGYLQRLLESLREYDSTVGSIRDLEARKKAREDRLALLQADLASLNPEDHVPAGEPLPRDDGESPRGYLQRLLESLREYDSTVGSIRDLEARKKAREDRLALLQADLASLNPEDHVPAGEPLPRDDGESPRGYLQRLLESLREYDSTVGSIRDLEARKKAREDRLALLQADLASLNPEDHVPAGEPLPRDDGESPRGYLQRLLESLREYDSTVGSIRDLEARKKAREDRLALLQADLASLNPEDHVPAGEPLPRDDGESPRGYLQRLLESLREYDSTTNKISDLTRQRAGLESRLDGNEDMYGQEARYLRLREDALKSAHARLKGYDKLERDMENNRIEQDRMQADLDKKTTEVSVAGERIRSKKERADQLNADIKEAKEHLSRHELYRDHEEWLNSYFIPSVQSIEKSVMASLRYDFNEFYETWYSKLVDDPTKTSRVDERFGPVLEQDGYQQSLDSLSGGEKTSVALAYRLAINSTMRRQTGTLSSNLLILDEPTDGFSREQMAKVREILDSLKSEQIIMVSHETELEGYVEHVFRVTKNEGSSTVQKV